MWVDNSEVGCPPDDTVYSNGVETPGQYLHYLLGVLLHPISTGYQQSPMNNRQGEAVTKIEIIWSARCARTSSGSSISPSHPSALVRRLLHHPDPPREVVAKVVGGSISDIDGCPPAAHSPRLAFERPLPGELDVSSTPPNYEGDSAKIVSSGVSNTMQILGDNVSPPYHHLHVCKSSSPMPAHTKMHSSIDTKHTSPKKTSSGHQHAVPVKSNSAYTLAHSFPSFLPSTAISPPLSLGADPYLPGRYIVSFLRVFKQFACNIPRG